MNNIPAIRFTQRWERISAALIDMVILGLPWLMIEPLIDWYKYPWLPHLTLVFSAAYFAFFEGPLGKGQTPGKFFLGIRAIRTDGRLLSYSDALKRYLFVHLLPYILSLPALLMLGSGSKGWIGVAVSQLASCYYFLDLIVLFRDPQRRALHDYFSNSVVLKTRKQVPMGWPSDLPIPLPSVPWRRYWLGTSLVGLYAAVQIAMAFVGRSHFSSTPITPFQQALRPSGIMVLDAKASPDQWQLDIAKPSWNPINRKRADDVSRQQELVIWATRQLVKKKALNPVVYRRVVFNLRPSMFRSTRGNTWIVDTETMAAKNQISDANTAK
jgi:uncharacterized RDD family membrane protein YckC